MTADLDVLIKLLARLPGLGPRSARRAVLHLVKRRESLMEPLARALDEVARAIRICDTCGNVDTLDPCSICRDPTRDRALLCVVEDIADIWALDRPELFHGRFHVLGGTLSALDGIGPEDLAIGKLLGRAGSGEISEIVMALDATVDGQTTAHYITGRLAGLPVKVTALAHGLPVGGELDYLDEGTLAAAFRSRHPF